MNEHKNIFDNFLSAITDLLARIPTPFKIYHIPLDSFKKQFAGVDASSLREVEVQTPQMFIRIQYMANPITVIKCLDKYNEPCELTNSPRIEARISYRNKKTVLLFDTFYIDNNNLVGGRSRYITTLMQSIPLDEITKVEVQDGHKRYRYL